MYLGGREEQKREKREREKAGLSFLCSRDPLAMSSSNEERIIIRLQSIVRRNQCRKRYKRRGKYFVPSLPPFLLSLPSPSISFPPCFPFVAIVSYKHFVLPIRFPSFFFILRGNNDGVNLFVLDEYYVHITNPLILL